MGYETKNEPEMKTESQDSERKGDVGEGISLGPFARSFSGRGT